MKLCTANQINHLILIEGVPVLHLKISRRGSLVNQITPYAICIASPASSAAEGSGLVHKTRGMAIILQCDRHGIWIGAGSRD